MWSLVSTNTSTIQLLHSKLRGDREIVGIWGTGSLLWYCVSPRNITIYINEVSPAWPEWQKRDMLIWMGKVQEASTLPKIYRHLRNGNIGRNDRPQGKTCELIIQCQIVNLVYIHAGNIRKTEKDAICFTFNNS